MEEDAKQFRQFAAECRRLAERASPNDRETLLEIADAWVDCAKQEDGKMRLRGKKD